MTACPNANASTSAGLLPTESPAPSGGRPRATSTTSRRYRHPLALRQLALRPPALRPPARRPPARRPPALHPPRPLQAVSLAVVGGDDRSPISCRGSLGQLMGLGGDQSPVFCVSQQLIPSPVRRAATARSSQLAYRRVRRPLWSDTHLSLPPPPASPGHPRDRPRGRHDLQQRHLRRRVRQRRRVLCRGVRLVRRRRVLQVLARPRRRRLLRHLVSPLGAGVYHSNRLRPIMLALLSAYAGLLKST